MSSKLDNRLSPGDRRLLAGYGPAVLIIGAFLVMAILIPSVAPERDVANVGTAGSGQTGGSGLSTVSSTTTTTTTPTASGVTTPSANGVTQTTVPAGATPAAHVAGCTGPQVPGDPYSPPCISFSGSNGGATTRGVTANQITITYMNPTDGSQSIDQAIEAVTGSYNSVIFPETYAQMLNTLQELVTYFNAHFQFYGRQIVLKVFNGQQDSAGDNEANVQADALTVADTMQAFAEYNATSLPYVNALTAQHVLNFSGVYADEAQY